MTEKKDNLVYHYCSLNSFYSIVSNRSLWLTHLKSSNDKEELTYGKKLVDDAVVSLQQFENLNDSERFLLNRIENLSDTNLTIPEHYGSSFSLKVDSLAHWERYGDFLTGICFSINTSCLNTCHTDNHLYAMRFLNKSEIVYNNNEAIPRMHKLILDEIRRNFIQPLEPYIIDSQLCPSDPRLTPSVIEELNWIISYIYEELVYKCAPIYKNMGFEDEHEYRFYIVPSLIDSSMKQINSFLKYKQDTEKTEKINSIKMLGIAPEQKKHALIGNSIRSYFSLNLNEFWSSALINHIIIGPKCTQNESELVGFLKANGLDNTKVSVSQIPIR